jgi:hypothetical protein
MSITGISTAFGLGFLYFIAAVPAGVASGALPWVAALAAWLGYSAGAAVILLAGAPLRGWLVRKLKIPVERDPSKLVWRVWDRGGLIGLGLLAPVTIGPQAGSVLALAVGEKALRIFAAVSFGVVPWCVAFAVLISLGVKLAQ